MDTSSVIGGYVFATSARHYTVPEVVEEAKGIAAAASIGASLDSGRLKIWEASPANISRVRGKLGEIGGELSDTDVKVIALALDLEERGLEPIILTDDYAMQNLARVLDVRYSSIATRGIKSVFEWKKVCPGCGRTFAQRDEVCPVCGTKLRRVAVKKPC